MNTAFRPYDNVLERLAHEFYGNKLTKKTHLYFASRISWSSFDRYLVWLKNKNFVECKIDGKNEQYQLTKSGREMFNSLIQFRATLNH